MSLCINEKSQIQAFGAFDTRKNIRGRSSGPRARSDPRWQPPVLSVDPRSGGKTLANFGLRTLDLYPCSSVREGVPSLRAPAFAREFDETPGAGVREFRLVR